MSDDEDSTSSRSRTAETQQQQPPPAAGPTRRTEGEVSATTDDSDGTAAIVATTTADDSLDRKIRQGQLRAATHRQKRGVEGGGPAARRVGVTADDSLQRKIAQGQRRFESRAEAEASPPSSSAAARDAVESMSSNESTSGVEAPSVANAPSSPGETSSARPRVLPGASAAAADDSLARKIRQGQRLLHGRRSLRQSKNRSAIAQAGGGATIEDDSLARKIRQGQLRNGRRMQQRTSEDSHVARTSVTGIVSADDSLARKIAQGLRLRERRSAHGSTVMAPANNNSNERRPMTNEPPSTQSSMEGRRALRQLPDVTDDSLTRKIRQGQLFRNSRSQHQDNNLDRAQRVQTTPSDLRDEDAPRSPLFLTAPETSPIEEPNTPRHSFQALHAGDVRLGGGSKRAAAVVVRTSGPSHAAALSPIKEPPPFPPQHPIQQGDDDDNVVLGQLGRRNRMSAPPPQGQSRAERIRAVWRARHRRGRQDAHSANAGQTNRDGGVSSLEGTTRTPPTTAREEPRTTAPPGAHRLYSSTGVIPDNDVESSSDTVRSASSDDNDGDGRSGASVVTSDVDGNPILGFVPYGSSNASDADRDNLLVEGVREYLRIHAPLVASVTTTPSEGEVKASSAGRCLRHPRRLLLSLFLLVVAAAIVAPTAVLLTSSDKNESADGVATTDIMEGDGPTSRPSYVPTRVDSSMPSAPPSGRPSVRPSTSSVPSFRPTVSSAPTSENWSQIKHILSSLGASVGSAFSDASSPQSRALRWLAEEDLITSGGDGHSSSLLVQNETSRIIVRYALAVLYFSTGGEKSWRNQYEFLSADRHECLWRGPYECAEDDPVGWTDRHGRDCAWYAQGSNCDVFGWDFTYEQSGYTASEACCACRLQSITYDQGVYCEPNESGDPVVRAIVLEYNHLSGTLPNVELGLLQDLERIWMSSNMLGGEVPSSIGHLHQLKQLVLFKNKLRGAVPSSIERLDRLVFLDLSMNDLTGAVPQGIGNMSSLELFWMDRNKLTGTVPSSVGNLVRLKELGLNENQLKGSIPPSIGNMTNLRFLQMYDNQLTGEIPSAINELHNLELLYLDLNFLTGRIPLFGGGLTSLRTIFLSGNMLTGSLPTQIGTLPSLKVLDVSANQVNGTIPTNLGELENLIGLFVASNAIGGTLPPSLAGLSSLQQIDISANAMSGTIPSNLGQHLIYFQANSNALFGSIPSELGKLQSLQVLEVGGNKLTGTIASEFGESSALHRFNVSNNFLNGTVPTTFISLVNRVDPWGFDDLLLHNNHIAGNISFLCSNNNERLLIFADCGGSSPEAECSCCRMCCDRDGSCVPR